MLGLVRWLRRRGDDDDDDEAAGALRAGELLGVAGITIANGAANISLYTPVFRTISPTDTVLTIVVFLLSVAGWCVVGRAVGTHPKVTETLERVEHWRRTRPAQQPARGRDSAQQ